LVASGDLKNRRESSTFESLDELATDLVEYIGAITFLMVFYRFV